MLATVRETNNKLVTFEQNFESDIQSVRPALVAHDTNVRAIHERMLVVESGSQESITAAVTAAVDVKINSLQAQISELKSTSAASSAASTGSSRSRVQDAGGHGPSGPRGQADANTPDSTRRWIGTFPRTLFARERRAHWEQQVLPLLPEELSAVATPVITKSGKSYSITFPSENEANRFSTIVNSAVGALDWVDKRSKVKATIKVRGDMPMDVRSRQRACSHIFVNIMELLKRGGANLTKVRLGVNGYQGMMSLYGDAEDGEIWEPVYIRGNDQVGWSFEPNLPNLASWMVSEKDAVDALAEGTAAANTPH